ncbi:MAG: hypothetical protein ACI9GH_000292 [Candidatus Paceibacteria bacterium]|jgi:hypothetical protein
MWGIEFYQLLSFGRQFGWSVMGAASLWGIVFLHLANNKKMTDPAGVFLSWIGLRMRWLVVGGGLLVTTTWFLLTMLIPTQAHEGVTLVTTKVDTLNAMLLMTPLYLGIIGIVMFFVIYNKKPSFLIGSRFGFSWFYPVVFLMASIGISYYTDLRGLPLNEIIFHIFHGFHSIFTIGTVLCLDLLFLSTQNAPFVQRNIFPYFPKISKVIWIGLSLDLLSTLLIYPQAIVLTPRFYFAQIVVGILIINGILLSGVITRRMLKNVKEGHKERTFFWEKFATVAGAISITSWTAITIVDQLHNITLSLPMLFLVYLLVICSVIIGHEMWNKIDTRAERTVE